MKMNMSRRNFLMSVGASALAGVAIGKGIMKPAFAHADQAIGVQLYTVRDAMAEDMATTLERVAAIGYREVEFAGYFDKPLAEIKAMLEHNGLTAPSAHMSPEVFANDFDRALEIADALGHKNLILPWLPPEQRSLDRFREIAHILNVTGEKAKAAGVMVGYHNHEFEFIAEGGVTPFDILMADTDADLVNFELDLFWLATAKKDPLPLMEKLKGRVPCVHVKDMDGQGNMVSVGDGEIDFKSVFEHRKEAGLKHFFVEHDNPKDPFESIKRSFEAFSKVVA